MNPERFLNSLVDYEKTPGYDYSLADFVAFLEKIGSPHKKLKNVIHIAGTKGKGATAAIIASILKAAGFRTGLFTSPHLRRVNERIKMNNKQIVNGELAYYIRKLRPFIRKRHQARTFFEVLTAIAFQHFIREKIDFTILETGLGGRLDTTNATTPLVSVITRIGYDHTQLLGKSLSAIAREKAGIIKYGIPVITIRQRPVVEQCLKKTAHANDARLVFADHMHTINVLKYTLTGSRIQIRGELGSFRAYLPLAGIHQIENLSLALAVIHVLRTKGFKIPTRAVQTGMRNTQLRGRFDVISPKKPLILFDGAHNRDSFQALEKNLRLFKIRNFFLIFGSSTGKDFRWCLENIFPRAEEVLLVKADHPRAIEPATLYPATRRFQRNTIIASSVKKALEYVANRAQRKNEVVITGSFYLWQKNWPV